MYIFVILIIFYLCIMLMSGFNTIIYRLARGKLGNLNYCYCENCKKRIPLWISSLPIINFIMLGGISLCCNKFISKFHPLSELIGGFIIFTAIFVLIGGII